MDSQCLVQVSDTKKGVSRVTENNQGAEKTPCEEPELFR